MTTALVSSYTGIPVRCDVCMTGEITLRGEVLPIGGLKEKLLAAVRGGLKTALIPEENVKDLTEIPDNIKNKIEIVPVKWIDQVLSALWNASRPSGCGRKFGVKQPPAAAAKPLPRDFQGKVPALSRHHLSRPAGIRENPLDTRISPEI
jgi:hypothetical protein